MSAEGVVMDMKKNSTAIAAWNGFVNAVMAIPGVKIDRKEFLKKELSTFCSKDEVDSAIKYSPLVVVDSKTIETIADSCIKSETIKTVAISAGLGIPGGFAAFGTATVDILQYYAQIFRIAQKLAYLYGFPDLLEKGKISDFTKSTLTLFIGIMNGANCAQSCLKTVMREMLEELGKRGIKKNSLQKTLYKVSQTLAIKMGLSLSKKGFQKSLQKVIPFVGAAVSGTFTFLTFYPCAKKLKNNLVENSAMISKAKYVDHYSEEEIRQKITEMTICAAINTAKVDGEVHKKERAYLEELLCKANLPEEECKKYRSLLESKSDKKIVLDFPILKCLPDYATTVLITVTKMAMADKKIQVEEVIYLKQLAKKIDYPKDELEDLLDMMEKMRKKEG